MHNEERHKHVNVTLPHEPNIHFDSRRLRQYHSQFSMAFSEKKGYSSAIALNNVQFPTIFHISGWKDILSEGKTRERDAKPRGADEVVWLARTSYKPTQARLQNRLHYRTSSLHIQWLHHFADRRTPLDKHMINQCVSQLPDPNTSRTCRN